MSTFVGIPRIPTAAPETEMDPQDARGVRMAVSVLLDYPGDDFETKLDAVEEALADLPKPASASLATFVSYARAAGLRAMQTTYVETFDQRRRCALGLTYYTHGDTRGRGQAILAFKEILRRAGFEMEREELPDHLPVVLEFAAFDETGSAEVHGIRTFACRVGICDAVAVLPRHCSVGGPAVRVLRDPHRGPRVALQDRPVRVDVSFLAVE